MISKCWCCILLIGIEFNKCIFPSAMFNTMFFLLKNGGLLSCCSLSQSLPPGVTIFDCEEKTLATIAEKMVTEMVNKKEIRAGDREGVLRSLLQNRRYPTWCQVLARRMNRRFNYWPIVSNHHFTLQPVRVLLLPRVTLKECTVPLTHVVATEHSSCPL